MPDTPDRQREVTRKPIVTLLVELANVIRQWAEAELLLARAELDDLSPGDNVDPHLASLTERGFVPSALMT